MTLICEICEICVTKTTLCEKMKAEETVSDLPGGDERLTGLEESRQPR